MNYSFKLSDVSIVVPEQEAEIKVGNMEISVQDLDIKDSFQFMREIPDLIRQIRIATQMPIGAPIIKSNNDNDDFGIGDEDNDEEMSEEDIDLENQMFKALQHVTNMDAHHFQGGISGSLSQDEPIDGKWSTQARDFMVRLEARKAPRRGYMDLGSSEGFSVYLQVHDNDDAEYGQQVMAEYGDRIEASNAKA